MLVLIYNDKFCSDFSFFSADTRDTSEMSCPLSGRYILNDNRDRCSTHVTSACNDSRTMTIEKHGCEVKDERGKVKNSLIRRNENLNDGRKQFLIETHY